MSVTSDPEAAPDQYTISATATRVGGSADNGSASVVYTVAPSGGGNISFTDNFNRLTLGGDWQVLDGSGFSIGGNELRDRKSVV